MQASGVCAPREAWPCAVVQGHIQTAKLIRKEGSHLLSFLFFFFVSLFVSASSSSPLRYPKRKTPLTSRWLCFCLDLRIEFFRSTPHQIWNRNCSLISLEAVQWGVGGGEVEGDKLPPSITPLCRLFSSERITSSPTPPLPTPPLHLHPGLQAYRNK